ncbi:NAD(P)H-quinone oxidoreductase subunit K chloroplastic [Bienertia sinuspersici]
MIFQIGQDSRDRDSTLIAMDSYQDRVLDKRPNLTAGTVTMKMAPSLVRLYEQMPEPKCYCYGACTITGGCSVPILIVLFEGR